MSAQASIWLCVALAALVFVIDTISVNKVKRAVLRKIEWEDEK